MHSQNPSHSFTQEVLSCCSPSPEFSSYCKQIKIDSPLGQSKEHYRNLTDLEEEKKKKTSGNMTHQSSVKGIPCNFRNVPFLSHLTPGQSTSPPGPLSVSGFLFPPSTNSQETCSRHPLPVTPAHSSPRRPWRSVTPHPLQRSRSLPVAKMQLAGSKTQGDKSLSLASRQESVWLLHCCRYPLSLNLRIFWNIAAPFLNIPDKCNSPVPGRVVFNWSEMCVTTERHYHVVIGWLGLLCLPLKGKLEIPLW